MDRDNVSVVKHLYALSDKITVPRGTAPAPATLALFGLGRGLPYAYAAVDEPIKKSLRIVHSKKNPAARRGMFLYGFAALTVATHYHLAQRLDTALRDTRYHSFCLLLNGTRR